MKKILLILSLILLMPLPSCAPDEPRERYMHIYAMVDNVQFQEGRRFSAELSDAEYIELEPGVEYSVVAYNGEDAVKDIKEYFVGVHITAVAEMEITAYTNKYHMLISGDTKNHLVQYKSDSGKYNMSDRIIGYNEMTFCAGSSYNDNIFSGAESDLEDKPFISPELSTGKFYYDEVEGAYRHYDIHDVIIEARDEYGKLLASATLEIKSYWNFGFDDGYNYLPGSEEHDYLLNQFAGWTVKLVEYEENLMYD